MPVPYTLDQLYDATFAVIEANGLVCGGGVFGPGAISDVIDIVVAKDREQKPCTAADRRAVRIARRGRSGQLKMRLVERPCRRPVGEQPV